MPSFSSSSQAAAPRLVIEYLPIADLVLDPENARLHSPAQIRGIARSIKAFLFNSPILVDRYLKVISGHGRVAACKLLGQTIVPVVRLEHLTDAQARAFALAENRLVETGAWNERQLAIHLKALSELDLDFSVEATGFTMGEIDMKIEGLELEGEAGPDPDDEPPPGGPPVCRPGDLWLLGEHRLLCSSSLEESSYQQLLGNDLVSCTFADPPYGDPIASYFGKKKGRGHREFVQASGEMSEPERAAFLTQACRLAGEHSVAGAVGFWCMDWRNLMSLLAAGRASACDLINICVWAKTTAGMGTLYRSAHELVVVFRTGAGSHRNNVQLGRFGRNRTNVWSYPGANVFLRGAEEADLLRQHPTPKPVAMVADALLDVTARRDLVLDPFLGSGATLMAAERTGRICRGIDLDPLYIDLSIRRWQRHCGEAAVLERTGETFDDLARQAEAA